MQTLKEFKRTLEDRILKCDQVIITPHKSADFDAISSAIGFSLIAKKLNKPYYIFMNDDLSKIDPGVKMIIEENKSKMGFINLEQYQQIKGKNDLLIMTDVNKSDLIYLENNLHDFSHIVILDHHREGETTVQTEDKYIKENASSACEIMTDLLCLFNIKYDKDVATLLYTGIFLDTDHLRKLKSSSTMRALAKLMERGADLDKVNSFFEEDFVSDRRIQMLVNKADFFTYTVVAAIADDDMIYTKEELSKVADYLLRFKADASFALGRIDEKTVSISARGKGKVDVADIMTQMGGGGDFLKSATKIESDSTKKPAKVLKKIITPSFYKTLTLN